MEGDSTGETRCLSPALPLYTCRGGVPLAGGPP
jgi:hypothetical protein